MTGLAAEIAGFGSLLGGGITFVDGVYYLDNKPLARVNFDAQLFAGGVAVATAFFPPSGPIASVAGGLAFTTQSIVTGTHAVDFIKSLRSFDVTNAIVDVVKLAGDIATLAGDGLVVAGGLADGIPVLGWAIGTPATVLGVGFSMVGLGTDIIADQGTRQAFMRYYGDSLIKSFNLLADGSIDGYSVSMAKMAVRGPTSSDQLVTESNSTDIPEVIISSKDDGITYTPRSAASAVSALTPEEVIQNSSPFVPSDLSPPDAIFTPPAYSPSVVPLTPDQVIQNGPQIDTPDLTPSDIDLSLAQAGPQDTQGTTDSGVPGLAGPLTEVPTDLTNSFGVTVQGTALYDSQGTFVGFKLDSDQVDFVTDSNGNPVPTPAGQYVPVGGAVPDGNGDGGQTAVPLETGTESPPAANLNAAISLPQTSLSNQYAYLVQPEDEYGNLIDQFGNPLAPATVDSQSTGDGDSGDSDSGDSDSGDNDSGNSGSGNSGSGNSGGGYNGSGNSGSGNSGNVDGGGGDGGGGDGNIGYGGIGDDGIGYGSLGYGGSGDGDSGGGDSEFHGGGDGGRGPSSIYHNVLPIVLDLTGNGIKITPLGSSNTFLNIAGDGYEHRTAWAGVGNGVLVYDPSGSAAITKQMVDFTSWDPTAKSDLQALKDVFDTNHDGQLDAGDAGWNNFRVLVTNANGTTSLETLQQLGITSINLTSNKQSQSFVDGSEINGETTYTTSSGQTRAVADVSLAYDPTDYVTSQTVTANADGSTTIDVRTFTPDGSLVSDLSKVISANGATITLTTSSGSGVVERVQVDSTVTNANGSTTETLADYNGANVLTDKTVTTTASSGGVQTVTIDRYDNGGNTLTQSEVRQTQANGTLVDTISNLNPDGSLQNQTVTTTTATGLSKTIQEDNSGNGTFDRTITDATIVNADSSTTETVSAASANGSLEYQTITYTSATGASKTIQTDSTGNGTVDLTSTEAIAVGANGSTVTTQTDYNQDGSMRDQMVTTLSANDMSQVVQIDHAGNGVFDLTTSTVTTGNSDGSTTKTVEDTSANGALLDETVTTVGANQQTMTTDSDTNGALNANGTPFWNYVETIAVNSPTSPTNPGAAVDTVSQYAGDGALTGQTITTTSANGLTKTTQTDLTGDGTNDLTTIDQTVQNSGGGQTETVSDYSANNTLLDRTTTMTSANGLSMVTLSEPTASAGLVLTHSDVTTFDAAGDETETVGDYSANNTLLDQTITTTNASQTSATTQTNFYGLVSGVNQIIESQTETDVTSTNGTATVTVGNYAENGTLLNQTATITSANGLSVTTQIEPTGTSGLILTTTHVTVINPDGSRTETVIDETPNGSERDQTVRKTSANGLSITTQSDSTGAGSFTQTRTDVTVINANGSRTETVTDKSANGGLIDDSVATTSANGLSITTQSDPFGLGSFTATRTDGTVLNNDGSTTETVTDSSANGTVLDQTVTTTAASGQTGSQTVTVAGVLQQSLTTTLGADGSTTSTTDDFAPNGALLGQTVMNTSADRLVKTTKTEPTGSSAFVLTQTDSTIVNADGSQIETVQDLSANGSLLNNTVATTSASGLSVTTQSDPTGSGSFTSTTSDVTVLNPDGSTTETVTDYSANNTVLDQTTRTISANQMTVTVDADTEIDGSSVTTQSTTTITNADGSTTKTVTSFDDFGTAVSGSVISSVATTTSANGLSTTTVTTIDGAGAFVTSGTTGSTNAFIKTRTDNTVVNADGSTTETVQDLSGNGSLLDQTITTTSANGLSVTTRSEPTASASLAYQHSDVTVLNADGSTTETVADTNPAGSIKDQTVITTSANGLINEVQSDSTGNGTFDLTTTDTKVLNADGSMTETVVQDNADGSLRGKAVTTTSASGTSSTATENTTGSAFANITTTTAIIADGSQVVTTEDVNASGTATDEVVTTTSANGLSQTIQRDTTGAGTFNETQTDFTVLNADGSTIRTVTDSGAISDQYVVATSANGLVKTTQWDLSGTGNYSETRTGALTLNADGSTTETLTDSGSTSDATVTINSANGQQKTVYWEMGLAPSSSVISSMEQGEGTTLGATQYGTVVTNTVVNLINQNESGDQGTNYTTVDTIDYTASGQMKDHERVTTSADGLSVLTQRDTTGSGTFNETRSDVTVLNTDGSSTETIGDTGGTFNDLTVVTTSASGLSTTWDWDNTGGWAGAYAEQRTSVTTLNADGSSTTTISDTVPSNLAPDVVEAIDTFTNTVSADGLVKSASWSMTGTPSDPLNESDTDTTTINSDGSKTETITDSYNGNQFGQSIAKTAASGLSETTTLTSTLWATEEQTNVTAQNADGSRSNIFTEYNANNVILDSSVTTTSGDGRLVRINLEDSGNGLLSESRSTMTQIDGSQVLTVIDYLASGAEQDESVTTTNAQATSSATNLYFNGSNIVGGTRTDVTTLNLDGSSTETITSFYANGSVENDLFKTTSVDGRLITLNEDTTGIGVFDVLEETYIEADGSKIIFETDLNADRSIKDILTKHVSMNGLETVLSETLYGNNSSTGTTVIGYHNATIYTNIDGSTSTTAVDLNSSGTETDNSVERVSADGRQDETWTYYGSGSTLMQYESTVTALDGSSVATDTYYGTDGQTVDAVVTTLTDALGDATTFVTGVNAQAGLSNLSSYSSALANADNTFASELSADTNKPTVGGYTLSASGIYIEFASGSTIPAGDTVIGTLSNSVSLTENTGAPTTIRTAETSVITALTDVTTSASKLGTATLSQTTSDTTAQATDSARLTPGQAGFQPQQVSDPLAQSQAGATDGAWANVFLSLAALNTQISSATTAVTTAQTAANAITITSQVQNYPSYATTEDYQEAVDAVNEQGYNEEGLSAANQGLQQLLNTIATAWNVNTAVLLAAGGAVTSYGNELIIAGAGTETATGSVIPVKYAIMSGVNLTISNFYDGPNGSVLDFLQDGSVAYITQSGSGNTLETQITVGTSEVTLLGYSISSLSLYNNIVGVDAVNISYAGNLSQSLASPLGNYVDDGSSHLQSITMSGGTDTLTGNASNNILTASAVYSQTLVGGGGNDTYVVGINIGSDTIVNGLPTNTGPTGTLQLGSGINPLNLWFSKASNGADLVIQILGTTSEITVQGWFTNSYSQLATLTLSDGSQITAAQINILEAAMVAYQAANPSFNPQTATSVPGSSSLLASALATGWARTINDMAGNLTTGGVYGNDTYQAGTGDILTGGSGQNTYILPSASGSQTTISDFKVGASGDSLQLPSGDSFTATTIIQGDLLIADSGGFEVITSTGATEQFAGPGAGYTLAATGNFLGTGRSAALWVNASGQLDLMASTGTGFMTYNIGSGVPAGAKVLATADFNGDGKTDVLWGVVSGTTETLWESVSNGTGAWTTSHVTYGGVNATVTVGASAASYSLLSTSDQNDDGTADLLWQVTTSAGVGLATWTMNGTTISKEGYETNSAGTIVDGTTTTGHYALTSCQIFTGDFNGDGKMDYLFYTASTGQLQLALAGTGVAGADTQPNVGYSLGANAWTLLATADINGDGKSDILWESVTATNNMYSVAEWQMNGGTQTATPTLGSINATTHLLGEVDLNGDGKADLVWQDSSSNQVSIWWGGSQAGATTFNPGVSLTVASIGSFLDTLQLTYGSGSSTSTVSLVGVNDIYVFSLGHQSETIVNGLPTNTGPTGTLQLGSGINPLNLWFSKASNGADLVIQILGTTSEITVQGWFTNSYSQLATLTLSDGSQITAAQINILEAAMVAYQAANPSFNPQTATSVPGSSSLLASALATGWARTINDMAGNLTTGGVYGNDTYQAGTGDILTGGSGQNTYILPSASGSQTTISDFKVGASGDSLQLPSGDSFTATTIIQGDLLIADSGGFEVITSTGATEQFAGPGAGYTLAATGNFLGTGRSAALWVNASGQLDLMASTGTGFMTYNIGSGVPAGAKVLATADFNGDGKTDVLWGVVSGTTETLWESVSNGTGAWTTSHVTYGGVNATVTVGASAASYSLLSTSDQNDDGTADLLWQVTTSAGVGLATWTMNGTTISKEGYETNSAGTIVDGTTTTGHYALTNSQIFTGDFNGDGKMDYLFYTASTGQLQLALAGTGVAGADTQPNVGYSLGANAWTLLATADINGDGKSDILWESVTATNNMYSVAEWQMNGGTQTATPTLGSINATTHLLGEVDLNGDGKADLVWQDSSSNQVSIWWGGSQAGATTFNPGVSLTVASIGSFLDTLQLTYGSGSSTSTVSLVGVTAGSSLNFTGTSGNDTFDEGTQNGYSAIFDGDGGSDIYKLGLGYQSFTIVNGLSTNAAPTSTLQLGTGITPANLWFSQSGNNLAINVLGTQQSVTVSNWFKDTTTTSWEQLAHIAAGGETVDNVSSNGIESLIQAMAAFDTNYQTANGIAFDPTATANATITNQAVLTAVGSAWHH